MGENNDKADIGFDRSVSMHHQDLLHHQDPMHHQDAMQNKERNKLLLRKLSQSRERERGKEREQERERLHQLQSINNLLLDLPPSSSHFSNFSQDTSSTQSDKNISLDGRIIVNFTESYIFVVIKLKEIMEILQIYFIEL